MKEELLHFLWQNKTLAKQALVLSNGEETTIINAGTLNHNAGPDFFNAKIKIGKITLVGNIEIHLRASDWKKHQHQKNRNYDNVILHVVYENDETIFDLHNKPLLTLELKKYISPKLLQRYQILFENKNKIPCEAIFSLPEKIKISHWLQRLAIERLEQKCKRIEQLFDSTNQNWEQTFYILTAKYFGQKINDEPFERLAKNVELKILAKHKNKLSQIEALILGTAGFLETKFNDEYLKFLQQEFLHLKKKYDLKTIEKSVWKFARTRPANFPTVRLLQFASLIYQSQHLFSKILEADTIEKLIKLYQLSQSHIINMAELSDKKINNQKSELGMQAIETIIINTVSPILFLYGKMNDSEIHCDRSIAFLEKLSPEKNGIVSFFNALKIETKNAAQTQALLQLKNEYCNNKKCLSCAFGNHILCS